MGAMYVIATTSVLGVMSNIVLLVLGPMSNVVILVWFNVTFYYNHSQSIFNY